MKKRLFPLAVLALAGCGAVLPPGASAPGDLATRRRAAALLASYDREAWVKNSAFSVMADEPVSSAARDAAAAAGLAFLGYAVPPAEEGVVTAEIGPVDDMSRLFVMSSVVEASTETGKTPPVNLVVDDEGAFLVPAGVPAYYGDSALLPPPVPAPPPAGTVPAAPPGWTPRSQPPAPQPGPAVPQPGTEGKETPSYYYYAP